MQNAIVEVYSRAVNKVVLRLPGRRYPGIVIQGDDLSGLIALVNKASSLLSARFRTVSPDAKELEGLLALHRAQDELRMLLKHYNRVARSPWSPPDAPN